MLENTLAKRVDKHEALRSFEELSEQEKNRIVVGLRSKIQNNGDAPEQARPAENRTRTLKPVHEMNLSEEHKAYIQNLSQQHGERVPKSKHNALVHQLHFVDQRKVAMLKRALKSMQFQLTYERAEGAYLNDVDVVDSLEALRPNSKHLLRVALASRPTWRPTRSPAMLVFVRRRKLRRASALTVRSTVSSWLRFGSRARRSIGKDCIAANRVRDV